MADESFIVKLSASPIPLIISFLLLFTPSASQSLYSTKAETLATSSWSTGQCNIFSGEWIRDPSNPIYNNATCSWLPSQENCIKNGRPDTDYLHWRWKPLGCDLPPIDAASFLDAMRHKSLLYIGEFIIGNQGESLLCILSQVEKPMMLTSDEETESKEYYFPTYNFTFTRVWSPFIVASNEKWSDVNLEISLDVLDEAWTTEYHRHDYVYFAGGQWYLKSFEVVENHTVIGCHYCPGKKLKHLDVDYAYRKALRLTYDFMTKSGHKPLVIYRSWVPSHNEHDPASGAQYCNRTQPFKEGEYTVARADPIMRKAELEELEKARKNGLHVKDFDIYHLSLLRPDAHPGPYRVFQPDISKSSVLPNDCLHWCLPGVPDTWNQLLMTIILREENSRPILARNTGRKTYVIY